eukprot:TRINITY_DN37649_c0_g1_i1.p1 TRINITY_DN37649_c0_g1~~TRINITY_DN37649_c0_g1_i1.p1  ORF type:complete len:189 (+),score=46.08 TRINITY_DN37649_c0_g1_i1:27-569(+)
MSLSKVTEAAVAEGDAEGTDSEQTVTCREVKRTELEDLLQTECEQACKHLIRSLVMQGKEDRGRGLMKELGGAVLRVPEVKRRKYYTDAMNDPIINLIRDKGISAKRNQRNSTQQQPRDTSVKTLHELATIADQVAHLNSEISLLTSSMVAADDKLPIKLSIDRRKTTLTNVIETLADSK